MDFSPRSSLTALQTDLLREFFAREQRFFLTGGAALAGFHFGHRVTEDLDFFSPPGTPLEEGALALSTAAQACGAEVAAQREHPEFRRYLVSRGDETCLVDLVVDRAPMIVTEKLTIGRARVDPLREIAANKICTLLGRVEVKDLLDVQQLLAAGIDLAQAVADAERKDAGVSVATLAWLMDDTETWTAAGGERLADFRADLAKRFRAIAFAQARKD